MLIAGIPASRAIALVVTHAGMRIAGITMTAGDFVAGLGSDVTIYDLGIVLLGS